jgi:hypothetical protein
MLLAVIIIMISLVSVCVAEEFLDDDEVPACFLLLLSAYNLAVLINGIMVLSHLGNAGCQILDSTENKDATSTQPLPLSSDLVARVDSMTTAGIVLVSIEVGVGVLYYLMRFFYVLMLFIDWCIGQHCIEDCIVSILRCPRLTLQARRAARRIAVESREAQPTAAEIARAAMEEQRAAAIAAAAARAAAAEAERAEIREVILQEVDQGVCSFSFLAADFIRSLPPERTSLPHMQALQQDHPEIFTVHPISRHSSYRGEYRDAFCAVSHAWDLPGAPDSTGVHLAKIRAFLDAHPRVKWIWYRRHPDTARASHGARA